MLDDVHTFLTTSIEGPSNDAFAGITLPPSALNAVASTNLESVVLLGHSLGGIVAVEIISGEHA